MKFFAIFALMALFAVAYAQPVEVEPEKPALGVFPKAEGQIAPESDPARDKRGILLNGGLTYTTYTAPYTTYNSPYVYSGNYYYPYAYGYRSYPYIYSHYY